jgi:RimJ/RimL family protein N-acetyltransferase
MDFAFDSLGFTYLIAATDPPNRSSMAVARRLGMTLWQEKEHEGRKTIFFRKEHI